MNPEKSNANIRMQELTLLQTALAVFYLERVS